MTFNTICVVFKGWGRKSKICGSLFLTSESPAFLLTNIEYPYLNILYTRRFQFCSALVEIFTAYLADIFTFC